MHVPRSGDDQDRILKYWWLLELLSPQQVPKPTPRATRAADRQVVEWKTGDPFPWEALRPPASLGSTRRVWQHTVYLGVYDLEATYEHLHAAFGEDVDGYDERPPGRSACAGMLVDEHGRLVADSATMSSALWAVGRLVKRGVQNPSWADGFLEAMQGFVAAVDEYEGARRESSGTETAPAQDAGSLTALLRIAQQSTGIAGTPGLGTETVIIRSMAVSAHRLDHGGDIDFLNSFFLDDLSTVRAEVGGARGCGAALAAYLTSDDALDERDRVDVIRSREATDLGAGVERLPKGRWPSAPHKSLSLRQQFAVNQALNDLAPARGLMGVNGPPGTGKTTMLRDVLAGNVVERARCLAGLTCPDDAFTAETHRWTASDGYRRDVRQLRPELTGYEMVVVSANNAAVENVTTEIPARDAIDVHWHDEADYFADIATAMLADTDEHKDGETPKIEAWGMVAARLGNKRNRSAFHSAFWFDKVDPDTKKPVPGSVPRMQTRLAQWRDGHVPHNSWDAARAEFTRAEQRVDALLGRRKQAQERLRQLPNAIRQDRRATHVVVRIRSDAHGAADRLRTCRAMLERAARDFAAAAEARARHVDVKPGMLETILTVGRSLRAWRGALTPFDDRLRAADAGRRQAEARHREVEDHVTKLREDLSAAEAEQQRAAASLWDLQRMIAEDKEELGPGYPDERWTGDSRELRAPWLDAELDAARSDLFLAALQLHEDFLANAAADMVHGLRAALDVIAGVCPHRLEPEKRRAAWQLFFLVVPLVSTTFASFGRMFGNIGSESIGWLLIDEAGQASPQYAAGSIWRAQRVVAVGDPLQLQPVVTIPQKVQRDLAAAYRVPDTWIPPQASVQTLADRVSRYGTTLQQADQRVWVSAPLTVHRRCDEPMFTLCNDIAYNGIMVNGVERRLDDPNRPDLFDSPAGPLVVPSHWVDEPALTRGTHLQENQIARLEKALAYLSGRGISLDEVIAISPFRAVADRLESLSWKYRGLRAGTIHTAQGRQASVVFLVLGGDPSSPGAKAWAASSVNLVNVAASRAKRRLFVIGDRGSWARHNYFHQLATSLPPLQHVAAGIDQIREPR